MNKEIGLRLVELVEKELKNSSNEVKESAKELEEELKKVKDNSTTQEKEIIEEITYTSLILNIIEKKCIESNNVGLIALFSDVLEEIFVNLMINGGKAILERIKKSKKENTKSDYSEKE